MRTTHILAEAYSSSRWLTTADVARVLRVTNQGVRDLVKRRQLACERTQRGTYLFTADAVRALALDRANTALVSVRPQMTWVRGEARQLRLRLFRAKTA